MPQGKRTSRRGAKATKDIEPPAEGNDSTLDRTSATDGSEGAPSGETETFTPSTDGSIPRSLAGTDSLETTVGGPAPLAPPVPQTFDELARKAAKAGPRRGSVVQPPPAWQPDEVTLGFAMIADKSGGMHELEEPAVLATILIAVENDRRALRNRFAGGFDEEIDAVAQLFWPLLVMHGGPDGGAAIFDGTGVWKRTFRYTLLPSVDGVRPLLDASKPPNEYLTQMRALTPYFSRDPGAEVLTVEGFLPLDPPLLFDVLSQSRFRSDPQSAHAAFLPARHKVEWYEEVVRQMRQWLDRFESDLRTLGDLRGQIDTILKETRGRLEQQYRAEREAGEQRVNAVLAQVEEELAHLERSHRADIRQYLDVIRRGQSAVAHHETAIATSDTLAFRANTRRTDASPHEARGKQARAEIRTHSRQVAESRRQIEQIHARQRADEERVIGKAVDAERANAKRYSDLELFHDEYATAGVDILQAIDGQIAARSTQKNLLEGYFLPLPSLATVSVVWFPLWAATLRGSRGVRQVVFPPMQVRTGLGPLGALKKLFGGIVLPLEPRTEQFDKVLRPTMEEALSRDPWLSSATQELTRAADVLVDPDVLDRLRTGLGALAREKWITHKQEAEFLEVYVERARRRSGGGPAPPGQVPPGARVDGPPTRSS